jgi:hypothetical protein
MVGQQITLTASCSASPSGYAWTNCAGGGPQCTTTSANAGPVVYSVQATNNVGTSPTAGVQVSWQAPPTAPPVCTLSSSAGPNNPPSTNQSVQLTASCTNSPTSYTWTGCSGTGSTCTVTSASAGSQNYSVRATYVVGTGADASVTLDWQQSTAPPNFCGASNVVYLNESWSGTSIYPVDYNGAFGASQVLVVRITVPAAPASYATPTFGASIAEYNGAPVFRNVRLSRSPCDFNRGLDPSGQNGPIAGGDGTTAGVLSSVGTGRPMRPGETYYLSIRNMYFDGTAWQPSCHAGACNMIVGFTWPR